MGEILCMRTVWTMRNLGRSLHQISDLIYFFLLDGAVRECAERCSALLQIGIAVAL